MIKIFRAFKLIDRTIIYSSVNPLLIVLLLGCTYHDIKNPRPCSCEYPVKRTFQALPTIALNTTEGFLLLSVSEGFYKVCNDIDSTLFTDGSMVVANGRLKTTCSKADPYYGYMVLSESHVLLDDWTIPQDTIFNTSTDEIHIIRSEDYGYSPGFGFKILSIKGDWLQPTNPFAAGGGRPFKTATEAFKVAVLIIYKGYLKQPIPLTPGDMIFLKIDLS